MLILSNNQAREVSEPTAGKRATAVMLGRIPNTTGNII
jgi:hypothetical protein